MEPYEPPDTLASTGNDAPVRDGRKSAIASFTIAIIIAVYKWEISSVIQPEPLLVLFLGVMLLVGTVTGIGLGTVGVYRYFRHRNKQTLVLSILGLILLLYFFASTLYYASITTHEIVG